MAVTEEQKLNGCFVFDPPSPLFSYLLDKSAAQGDGQEDEHEGHEGLESVKGNGSQESRSDDGAGERGERAGDDESDTVLEL